MISYKSIIKELKRGIPKYDINEHYSLESLRNVLNSLRGVSDSAHQNLRVLKKMRDIDSEEDSKYSISEKDETTLRTNVILRLLHSNDKAFLKTFIQCKSLLHLIGINFGKKKGDDSYVVLLNSFFEAYMLKKNEISSEEEFYIFTKELFPDFLIKEITVDTYNGFYMQFEEINRLWDIGIKTPFSWKDNGLVQEWRCFDNRLGELLSAAANVNFVEDGTKLAKEGIVFDQTMLDEFQELEDVSDEDWELDPDAVRGSDASKPKKPDQVATLGTIEQANA
jgi:hypothetical protein